MSNKVERCCLCDEPTGRAGIHDDSIYATLKEDVPPHHAGDEIGPLCVGCFNQLYDDELTD